MEPDSGRVAIAGREPYALSREKRALLRARAVGFVFQQFHLIQYLSVFENVLVPSLASPSSGAHTRAGELIQRFGLSGRANHVPAELSTGECQRVALARSLLNRPAVLLADEPTGNLDPENSGAVMRALREFAGRGGTVLLVTHDPHTADAADRTLKLENGRLTG